MPFKFYYAGVAELADAHDSKSCSVRSVGSTPTFGTIILSFFISGHDINENGKKYVLQQRKKHDKLDLVASAAR